MDDEQGTQRVAGRKRDPHTDVAVVEAVLELIGAGATLSGLSLVTIAEHAGVSRNSLYRRWPSKDDLYLDVFGQVLRPLPEVHHPTAREDLVEQLEILIEYALDPRASSMVRALLAESRTFPELYRRYFAELIIPRREAMYRVVQRGIDLGEIRPDTDAVFLNEMLAGPIIARMVTGETDRLDPQQTSERMAALIFEGIRVR